MKVTDPVCGMSVDLEKAVAQEDYKGWAYFFCSNDCHRLFKLSPEGSSKGVAPTGVNPAPNDIG